MALQKTILDSSFNSSSHRFISILLHVLRLAIAHTGHYHPPNTRETIEPSDAIRGRFSTLHFYFLRISHDMPVILLSLLLLSIIGETLFLLANSFALIPLSVLLCGSTCYYITSNLPPFFRNHHCNLITPSRNHLKKSSITSFVGQVYSSLARTR